MSQLPSCGLSVWRGIAVLGPAARATSTFPPAAVAALVLTSNIAALATLVQRHVAAIAVWFLPVARSHWWCLQRVD